MESISELHGARWVGLPQEKLDEIRGNTLVYFRTKFTLKKLGSMQIAVSGHSRYKLWVNGNRAAVGPCKGDKWRHYYEVLDIGKYLVRGENIIAMEVVYYPPAAYGHKNMGGPMSVISNVHGPWIIVKGSCMADDGEILADVTTGRSKWMVLTDQAVSWIAKDPDAFMPVGAFEKVEGSKLPWGWKTDREIDGSWEPAVPKWDADGSAWGEFSPLPLLKRPIPLMYEDKKTFVKEMQTPEGGPEPIYFYK